MFYDRLLNLKSLKTRLLSSSSFAPLYSGDRKMPLAKFRRECISLTALIAGLLAACGGSTKYVPVGDVVITGGDGSGDDTIIGGGGNDTIDGGAGINLITIYKGRYESAKLRLDIASDSIYDVITYFSILDELIIQQPGGDTTYSFNNNAIESTTDDTATVIVHWVQENKSNDSIKAGSTTNDATVNDTVIYHADTGDDWVLMVLEDFTGTLSADNFTFNEVI